jgi:16S rRNA processing protein RimM
MIYLGKIVNTHGTKGEIRILSDFKYKDDVFKKDNIVYINDIKYIIESYRKHKQYDMITLDSINDINDAERIKGFDIYINREDYKFSGILNEDLIGLNVYDNDIYKGKVVDILKGNKYDLLIIDGIKKHMVPNISQFIKKIDLDKKIIYIEYIRGLDNED